MRVNLLMVTAGLAFAGAGAGAASVVASIQQQEPTQTVTVDVATGPEGPRGPAGPAGPAGPPGAPTNCGAGFTWSLVVFNTPGGQKTIKACARNGGG